MSTPLRICALVLPLLLAACQQPAISGRFQCPGALEFAYNRQSMSVELTHNGQTFNGVMDEKRLMSWPHHKNLTTLPDSYAVSRKDPKLLMLYGGVAGTGLACRQIATR